MKKYVILGAALLGAFGYGSLALAQQTDSYYGRHLMCGDGWYSWLIGVTLMILIFAGAIAIIVSIVGWFGKARHGNSPITSPPARKHAMDILKERFARGEIEKEEFEEKRRALDE